MVGQSQCSTPQNLLLDWTRAPSLRSSVSNPSVWRFPAWDAATNGVLADDNVYEIHWRPAEYHRSGELSSLFATAVSISHHALLRLSTLNPSR
jgi:hypothetical protein